jgi:hypothetical protein
MSNELSIEEKLILINHKLQFWNERLNESLEAIDFLKNYKNQLKIDMNSQSIEDIKAIVKALQKELDNISI